jgi:hypothetical protein
MTGCGILPLPACSARPGSAAACICMRNAHVRNDQHAMVAAAIRQAFLQADAVPHMKPGAM